MCLVSSSCPPDVCGQRLLISQQEVMGVNWISSLGSPLIDTFEWAGSFQAVTLLVDLITSRVKKPLGGWPGKLWLLSDLLCVLIRPLDFSFSPAASRALGSVCISAPRLIVNLSQLPRPAHSVRSNPPLPHPPLSNNPSGQITESASIPKNLSDYCFLSYKNVLSAESILLLLWSFFFSS